MLYTRRDLGKIALAAVPLAKGLANVDSKFGGVQIGAITYSFRQTNDIDEIIKNMSQIGLGEAELMSNHAEAAAGAPQPAGRGGGGGGRGQGQGRGQGAGAGGGAAAGPGGPGGRGPAARVPRPPMTEEQIAAARTRNKELHDWRVSASMDKFKEVRAKFDTAGIDIAVLCYNMTEAITDEEIDYGFEMAKALGARAMSSTTQVSVSKRIAPFAEKHKMMIGFHGHDATWDPNEFATPETFATAMAYSKYFGVNLDIGHFTSANYDAIAYIKEHHDRITNLHLKDRTKDHGTNVPWGQGDTPIKQVLLLLKEKQYGFPANIEYEYGKPGMDTNIEVAKCYQFCKDVLS
jgi:sugar phosphate isomerase/epimerase